MTRNANPHSTTMASGHDALAAFIQRVEAWRQLNEDVAKTAAPRIEEAARTSAAAGQDPETQPWPTLRDGSKPLDGAAGAIKSSATGNRIELKIGKPWVYHQHGAAAGKAHFPKRKIIPDAGDPVPKRWRDVITEVAKKCFSKS